MPEHIWQFMIAFLIADQRCDGYKRILEEFIDRVRAVDVLQIALFKLYFYLLFNDEPKKDRERIVKLIAEGRRTIDGASVFRKGESKTQADILLRKGGHKPKELA